MKNYICFYGEKYYPNGGMEDFAGSYDTIEEAIFEMRRKAIHDKFTSHNIADVWWHIFSIKDNAIVQTTIPV